MNKKGENRTFLRVSIVVSIVLLLNAIGFMVNYGSFGITGSVISVGEANSSGSFLFSVFIFILQCGILLGVLIFTAASSKKIKISHDALKDVKIKTSLNKTDIDTLYELLLKKKQLRLIDVSKLFKVEKDVAMDWFKILESGNLGEIDYPMFGGPILKEYECVIGDNESKENKKDFLKGKFRLKKDEKKKIKKEVLKDKKIDKKNIEEEKPKTPKKSKIKKKKKVKKTFEDEEDHPDMIEDLIKGIEEDE